MSRRPWYKRYPSDFIAGTAMLTDAEKGVYSTIIDLLNDRGGPIEDSPADLARICGCASVKRFQGIKERLVKLGKLAVAGGHITNARFERDGTARIDQAVGDRPTADPPERPPDLLEINGLGNTLSQRPEARGQRSERRAGARTHLPENFALASEGQDYARQQGFDAGKTRSMFEQFADHHRAKGSAMADWNAAWRTWVRNETKFKGRGPSGGNGKRGGNAFARMAAQGVLNDGEDHDRTRANGGEHELRTIPNHG